MTRRRRRWIEAVAALIVVIAIVWMRCSSHAPKRAPPAPVVPVIPAAAERGDVPVHLETIGTVTSIATVSITSQVTGVIKSVRYREGQVVAQGTPLVEIDPRPFLAALSQAEGALHRDEQLLAQAKMDLERYRAAWAKNAIAKQLVDDQEHVERQIEGTVISDRAAVDTARIQLQYCHITAPIAGRVGLRLVDPGNLVTANSTTPLVVITQIQPISVVFPVSEDDLGELWSAPKHGDGLEVAALDRGRTRVLGTGAVQTIDNQIDTTTGTVRVRAKFENTEGTLFPNQFVNTRVLVKTLRGTVTVPSSALQRDGTKTFVYSVENGKAHVVQVTTGAADNERTAVQGLAAGTRVANSSFEKLREGVAVSLETPRQARGSAM